MSVSTSYQPFFDGRVRQREYAQQLDFEYMPNYSTLTENGVVTRRWIHSYTRNLLTARVVEQTFIFEGLSRSLAFGTGSVTVADLDGNEYTIPLLSSITDGSSGSRVMIVEEVQVQRISISPRLWTLIVTRRGFKYYVNGEAITLSSTPAWITSY